MRDGEMQIRFGAKARRPSDPSLIDNRAARLSRSLSGTNLERAGDYNLRTVLQTVRLNGDTTRVAIPDDLGRIALPHRPEGYERWNEVGLVAMLSLVGKALMKSRMLTSDFDDDLIQRTRGLRFGRLRVSDRGRTARPRRDLPAG